MKYLFFLLVLLNIVFCLWETGAGRPSTEEQQVKAPPAEERIMLVKELAEVSGKNPEPPAQPQPQAGAQTQTSSPPPQSIEAVIAAHPPAPPVQAPSEPAPVAAETSATTTTQAKGDSPPPAGEEKGEACHRLGPYASAKQAQVALDMLGTRQGQVLKKSTEVENGYVILYPPTDSLETARANRKMLVEKGFKDAWVVEQGENSHAISLAVVHDKDQADEAVSRYQAQGIQVLLKPRIGLANRWWLEVRGPTGRASLEAIAKRSRGQAWRWSRIAIE